MTVSLPATTGGCDAAGAICTPDGKALTDPVSATIQGPPALSVADAEVAEGPDAKLEFTITLSRAASGTVTVEAATSDGSAVAGHDYEAKSETVTFEPGRTKRALWVKIIDDDHDEDSETMTVTLSNPSGAYIADGTAVGTITNDGPRCRGRGLRGSGARLPTRSSMRWRPGWGRRGRPGTELSLAGRRVGAAGAPEDFEAREAEAGLETLAKWLSGADEENRDRCIDVPHGERTRAAERVLLRADRGHGRERVRWTVGPRGGVALRWARGRPHAGRRGGERAAGCGLHAGPGDRGAGGGAQRSARVATAARAAAARSRAR